MQATRAHTTSKERFCGPSQLDQQPNPWAELGCGAQGPLRSGWLRILPCLPPRVTIGWMDQGQHSSKESCAPKHLEALFLKAAEWGWECLGGQKSSKLTVLFILVLSQMLLYSTG